MMRDETEQGAPSGPGFHPSERAPAGLAADGVSIPRALWQPMETVPDSATVLLLCDGSLRCWKTGELKQHYFLWAAHRWKEPRQRKARWRCFDDVEELFDPESKCAVAWAPFPHHGIPEGEVFEFAPRVSDRSGEADETEGLGPKAESAARQGTPKTPMTDTDAITKAAEALRRTELYFLGNSAFRKGELSLQDEIREALAAIAALTALQQEPSPAPVAVKPPFVFTRYVDGIERAEGVKINKAKTLEQAMDAAVRLCPEPKTVLVYRSALELYPAREEAEALVKRLRSYEIFGPLSSLAIHPETPGITTGQVLRDTSNAADFIEREILGEKS